MNDEPVAVEHAGAVHCDAAQLEGAKLGCVQPAGGQTDAVALDSGVGARGVECSGGAYTGCVPIGNGSVGCSGALKVCTPIGILADCAAHT